MEGIAAMTPGTQLDEASKSETEQLPAGYEIKYTCTDAKGSEALPVIRRVNIKMTDARKPRPTLKILGKPVEYLHAKDDNFADSGATCTDAVDGEIDYDMSLPDNLNTLGRHIVTYTCKNSRGGIATAHRVVVVGPTVRAAFSHTSQNCVLVRRHFCI